MAAVHQSSNRHCTILMILLDIFSNPDLCTHSVGPTPIYIRGWGCLKHVSDVTLVCKDCGLLGLTR